MRNSSLIILGICGSRTERARSSLRCISVYGSIHHFVPSTLVMCLPYSPPPPRPSALSILLCTSTTIFPTFCLHCILRYIPFSLITFRMHANAEAFRETVASHSISLFLRCASRYTRDRTYGRGDLGLRNAKILLNLHAPLRRGTRSYLLGLLGDEAQNFELRSFASCTFLPAIPSSSIPLSRVYQKSFARILGFFSVRFASRAHLRKY